MVVHLARTEGLLHLRMLSYNLLSSFADIVAFDHGLLYLATREPFCIGRHVLLIVSRVLLRFRLIILFGSDIFLVLRSLFIICSLSLLLLNLFLCSDWLVFHIIRLILVFVLLLLPNYGRQFPRYGPQFLNNGLILAPGN